MTTKLKVAVTRETVGEYRPDGGGRNRPLIVTLDAPDVLRIRPKGTQREVIVSLETIYRDALLRHASIPQRRQ